MSYLSPNQTQPHILSKNSSTRSCQSFICLTQRCQQEEKKQKQKTLNSIYFQKLSLKKFNNTSTFNDTFYDKYHNDKALKRDKSTQDSDFRNINLNNFQREPQTLVSQNNYHQNHQRLTSYSQFQRNTQRIIRSSSYTQLNNQPQLKCSTERSIEKQIKDDLHKIQTLSKLRNTLQQEIEQLDHNIDKYYHVYHAKLEQLKKIQLKLKEIEKEEQKQKTFYKTPSTDNLCGQFKKKSYPEEVSHNNHQFGNKNRQKKLHLQLNTHSSNNNLNNLASQMSNRSPKYCPNPNMTFVKKIN